MNSAIIIVAIVCLLAGIILTWIIRKLVFEKSYVPAKQLEDINTKLQDAITQKAVLDERYGPIVQEKESFEIQLNETKTLYFDLIKEHAKNTALVETLSGGKTNADTELSQI